MHSIPSERPYFDVPHNNDVVFASCGQQSTIMAARDIPDLICMPPQRPCVDRRELGFGTEVIREKREGVRDGSNVVRADGFLVKTSMVEQGGQSVLWKHDFRWQEGCTFERRLATFPIVDMHMKVPDLARPAEGLVSILEPRRTSRPSS